MNHHDELEQELVRARLLFKPIKSFHEGISVIREEYLELESAIFMHTRDEEHIRKEAIQLAAMCLRLLEDLL